MNYKVKIWLESVMLVLCMLLLAAFLFATPAGVIWGLYNWISVGMEFKFALWEGVKVWGAGLFCIIPAVIIQVIYH